MKSTIDELADQYLSAKIAPESPTERAFHKVWLKGVSRGLEMAAEAALEQKETFRVAVDGELV